MAHGQHHDYSDDWLQPELAKQGYVGAFWPKPHSACQEYGYPPDGCALFYRQAVFDALLDTPKGFLFPAASPQSPTSQGVLLVHLRQKSNGAVLTVACTHLKAKAGEANELLREFQVHVVCCCADVCVCVCVAMMYVFATPVFVGVVRDACMCSCPVG